MKRAALYTRVSGDVHRRRCPSSPVCHPEPAQTLHRRFHQWLTGDVGDPLLAQHLHSLVRLQRLALANGHGWHRFLNSVNLVLPKRGETLEVPNEIGQPLAF